ncbi:MAG: HNH endonuclease signature motif containing protein [Planctomycetota bacterium]
MLMRENLPPDEIRRRLHHGRTHEQRWGADGTFHLQLVDDRRYYLLWGYASIIQFAEAELAMTPRQTRERLRVARALHALPLTRKALLERAISFAMAKEVTRVATRTTEADWLTVAQKSSLREVERLVAVSREGEVPNRPRIGLPRHLMNVTLKLTPEQMALLQAACKQHAAERGRWVDMTDVVMSGVRYLWSTRPEGSKRVQRSAAPTLLFVRCRECGHGAVATADGLVSVPESVLAEVESVARLRHAIDEDAVPDQARYSTPRCEEVPPDQRDLPASDAMRDIVLLRDGHRCVVPGCDHTESLHTHHVRWLRHGGKTRLDNLVTVCPAHHACIHQGILVLRWNSAHGIDVLNADLTPFGQHGDQRTAPA